MLLGPALAGPLLAATTAEASVVVNWDTAQRTLWVACETKAPVGQATALADLWWGVPYNGSQRIDLTEFTTMIGLDATPDTAHCYWFTDAEAAEELADQHRWVELLDSPYDAINVHLRSLERAKAIAHAEISWQGQAQAFYCDDTLLTQSSVSPSDIPSSCLPPPPGPDACDGHCGDIAPEGCWCDESCSDYGDCCPDKPLWCAEPGDMYFSDAWITQEFDWEGDHYELELLSYESDCPATEICATNLSFLNSGLWVGDILTFEVGMGGVSAPGMMEKSIEVYIDYDGNGVYGASERFASFGETSEETSFVFSTPPLAPAGSPSFAVPSVNTTMRIELWVNGILLDTVGEEAIPIVAQ